MKTLKMIPLAIALAASMGGDAASGPQYPERPANLDFERGDFGWKFGSDACGFQPHARHCRRNTH